MTIVVQPLSGVFVVVFFSKGGEKVPDKGPIALFLCPRGSAKLV